MGAKSWHDAVAQEAIFLANFGAAQQATPQAQALYEAARAVQVECKGCGEGFAAADLEGSTALCELCFEEAGLENAVQDGYITDAEFDEKMAAIAAARAAGS